MAGNPADYEFSDPPERREKSAPVDDGLLEYTAEDRAQMAKQGGDGGRRSRSKSRGRKSYKKTSYLRNPSLFEGFCNKIL